MNKTMIVFLLLAVFLIAADSYPIFDWFVQWEFEDPVNCGIVDGVPVIKITWTRLIMGYSDYWGWYKTAESKYTCDGLPPEDNDPLVYIQYLPLTLATEGITSSTRP